MRALVIVAALDGAAARAQHERDEFGGLWLVVRPNGERSARSAESRGQPVIRLFGSLSIQDGERVIGPGDLGGVHRNKYSRSC